MADDRDFKTPTAEAEKYTQGKCEHGRNDDANVEFGPERRQPRLVGEIRGIRPSPARLPPRTIDERLYPQDSDVVQHQA